MLCGRTESIEVNLEALEILEVCTLRSPAIEHTVIDMIHDSNLAFADEAPADQLPDSTISVLIG